MLNTQGSKPSYTKPEAKPAAKAGQNGQVVDSVGAAGPLPPPDQNSPTPLMYRKGYVTGYSQAIRLVEYLLGRGLTPEQVLEQLNAMLEEDILPWRARAEED